MANTEKAVDTGRLATFLEKLKEIFADKEAVARLDELIAGLTEQKASIEQLTRILLEAKEYADGTYQQATGYSDQKIADLIGGAPSTLDTLKEIADAIQENQTVVTALETAIGSKASAAEVSGHVNNNTIHVTNTEKTTWNEAAKDAAILTDEINANTAEIAAHKRDTTRHITATEREKWNDANTKKHTHTNKTILDGITETSVTAWNNASTHTGDTMKHTTAAEKEKWNEAAKKAAELTQSFIYGCSEIASTITANGVATASNASPATMSQNINNIRSGGDAAGFHILSGYTAYSWKSLITGTMPDHTGKPDHITASVIEDGKFKVEVSKGYHGCSMKDGSYEYMTCEEVANKIGLTGNKILSGNTICGVAGTIPNHSGKPDHIDAVRLANGRFEVAVHRGYHGYSWNDGSYEYLTYKQVADTIGLTPSKILSGNTICGVTGTAMKGLGRYDFRAMLDKLDYDWHWAGGTGWRKLNDASHAFVVRIPVEPDIVDSCEFITASLVAHENGFQISRGINDAGNVVPRYSWNITANYDRAIGNVERPYFQNTDHFGAITSAKCANFLVEPGWCEGVVTITSNGYYPIAQTKDTPETIELAMTIFYKN